MRNLVLALLAANVLYFVWWQWGSGNQPVLTAVVTGAPPSADAATPTPCATLGPFLDEDLAAQAEARLTAAGLDAQRRNSMVEIADGWWVYVASADTAAQLRAVEAIRGAGQSDAFAMRDDPQRRVSAGLFSDENRAEELAARIRDLGLDPAVEQRRGQQVQVWFDVPGMTRDALADGRLESLDLPMLDLTIEACPAP